jgi:hypothetical protein
MPRWQHTCDRHSGGGGGGGGHFARSSCVYTKKDISEKNPWGIFAITANRGDSTPQCNHFGLDVYIYLTTIGKSVGNTVSTANDIDHAALEGEMVTRVSKTRGPLSANGQDSGSGDAPLYIHA